MKTLRTCQIGLLAVALVAFLACESRLQIPVMEVRSASFQLSVDAEGILEAKEVTKISVPLSLRRPVRVAWLAPDGALLGEGDLIAQLDGSDLGLDLANALAELHSSNQDADGKQAESDIQISEQERVYRTAELELDFAQRFRITDGFVFSRHEILEDLIDEELAIVRRDNAETMTEIYQGLSKTEMEIIALNQGIWTTRAEEAQTGLESLEVKSPGTGVLRIAKNWRGELVSVGDQLWAGRPIAELPNLDSLQAEVFVLESDAGSIKEGQLATVSVDSAPGTVYTAQVIRLDAAAKPRIPGSPVQYFGVTLEFDGAVEGNLKPGQRVASTIIIEQFDKTIVIPRQAVFRKGQYSWVYRKSGNTFEALPVSLGLGSAALSTIQSGLEDGDIIALREPPGMPVLEDLPSTEQHKPEAAKDSPEQDSEQTPSQ